MADHDDDKSFEATPYRRQQAREQGQVARSNDLVQALSLVAGAATLLALGSWATDGFTRLTVQLLGSDAWVSLDEATTTALWNSLLTELVKYLLPFLALLMLVAVASQLMQGGLLFLPDKLLPNLSHLDLVQNWQRIFSLQSVVRLAMGSIKIVLILVVAGIVLWGETDHVAALSHRSVESIAAYLTGLTLWTVLKIALALLVLAVLDYGFQWWKHEQDLRMSFEEMRQEVKELIGDPQILARRKAAQKQLMANSLAKTVPTADFVNTNPTELAVAVKYDPEKMAAPIVVAKGAGVLAKRIRVLALENGIPVIERKWLAQALYKEVDVNQPIPNKLYSAVAEILRYVYRLKGKKLPTPGGQAA